MAYTIESKLNIHGTEILGKIPYDESMVYALLEGKTITEFDPKGQITGKLENMWNKIIAKIYELKSI